MCNGLIGFTGADCREFSPKAQFILAIALVYLFLALGLTVFGLILGKRLYHRRDKKPIPLMGTLGFATIGCFVFLIAAFTLCFTTAGFRDYAQIYTQAGRNIRRIPPSIDLGPFIEYAIASCVGVCSQFFLPLIWVGSPNFECLQTNKH
jgi:hypothetical protein